jgi:hypothetical protein
MENMKTGYIVKILSEDNIGIIREETTLTEWIYFLDETIQKIPVDTPVVFYRDNEFKIEEFVAKKVKRADRNRTQRAV